MRIVVPPSPKDLALAAYDTVRAAKNGKHLPREVWNTAHNLWWCWWADLVVALHGPDYLDYLAAGGWAGEYDRLLADYPRAAFPWPSVQELSEVLDQARESRATR